MPQHIRNASVSNMSLLCNKSITRTSHRQGVSVDFFERKCKKLKISRSEIVSQAQQVHPRYREFVTSMLLFTVFRIVLSHLTCCILLFYTFSAMFFMHFSVYLLAYMHISKCNRLLCALFRSTPLPSRSPFLGCSRPLAVLSATKNSTGSLFRAICAVPYFLFKNYIKRRAAPKSRPPTIQAML